MGLKNWLAGAVASAMPALPAGRPRASSEYMRGERSSIFSSWWPALRDAREDVRSAYWLATARTIEYIHNSGWLAGLVLQGKASILGDGLQLAPKPDYATLGWTQEEAKSWAAIVKPAFEAWGGNPLECDAAGKWNLHQQARSGIGSCYGAGEIVALTRWIDRPQSRTRTKMQLVPAHRLTQESDGISIFQGVRIDANGMPLSYRFRLPTPILESGAVMEMRARDGLNRPYVTHVFDGEIGQMRGLSPFTPVLQRVRQFDLITNGSLSAELQRALISATITSEKPTVEVMKAFEDPEEQGADGPSLDGYFQARGDWYDNTSFDLNGPVKIVHLFPGEKLDLKTGAEMTSVFEPQANMLLREIAVCAGHTVEEMTGDYNGVTYTGARISTTVRWPIMLHRRKTYAVPFYQVAYGCWLEEAIEAGTVPFPGGLEAFVANREAACRAVWRGPAKPQADDLKYAKSSETLKRMGVVTDERICAEMGEDWEDVYHQLAEEKKRRGLLGLPEPLIAGSTIVDEDELDAETGGDGETGGGRDDKSDDKGGEQSK